MTPSEVPAERSAGLPIKPAETTSESVTRELISSTTMKWAIRLILAYFGLRLLFFACTISSFVPPDEVTHAGLCRVFSRFFLLPDNSPETYQFGLVTNIPWLYYWSMGKLLHLNVAGIPDLVFLRLLNIPLAFGTVWYILRLLRLLTDDRLTQLLLLVVITNTPMFSFLSASASYDNLTNLLAAMAIYYLAAFFKYRSGALLAATCLCQLAGSMTKVAFLPLVLVLNVLLLIHEYRNLRLLPTAVKHYVQGAGIRQWLFAVTIFLFIAFNLQLYGGNVIRYKSLNPTMSDVLSPDISMEYRIGARENIFRLYTEGRISYMQALQMAGGIKHPGDKSDTFFMLMNYENLKTNPGLWMGLPQYAQYWLEYVVASIFGIKGHLPMFKNVRYLIPLYLLMALSLLGFAVRWRPREEGLLPLFLAATACCYTGYLMYKVNYNAYLYYGTPGITLQGRYLFPVIGPIFVLSCEYLQRLFRPDAIRVPLALATAVLFISYDFPWFLAHARPEWYEWLPR